MTTGRTSRSRLGIYYARASGQKVLQSEILRAYKTLRSDAHPTSMISTERRGEMRMRPTVTRLAALSAMLVVAMSAPGAAAGPDLRLINAVAEQDKTAIRALVKQGVDVNAPRADAVTALLC